MKLILILLISSFFRFYNLSQKVGFEYDQETTAWAAKQLLVDHKPVLLGMKTSVGNIFIGPLYFYLYSLPMIITRMNPIGQFFLSSLIGVVTTLIIYLVGKSIYNKRVALFAGFFHAISMVFIGWERPIWNVSGILLLSVIIYYLYYKINQNRKYWPLLFFFIGIFLHFHFTGIFYIPVTVLFIGYLLINKRIIKDDIKFILIGLILLFSTFLPLIIFDLRHGFINSSNLAAFLAGEGGNKFEFINKIPQILQNEISVTTSFLHLPFYLNLLLLAVIFIVHFKIHKSLFYINAILFGVVLLGFSMFRGQVTNYYYLILFPAVIYGVSYAVNWISEKNKAASLFIFIYLAFLLVINYQGFKENKSSFSFAAKQKIVSFITANANNKPYSVSYSIEFGRNFGFEYLFWLSRFPPQQKLIKPVYTIVIPYNYGGIKPDLTIEDIGLVLPKK